MTRHELDAAAAAKIGRNKLDTSAAIGAALAVIKEAMARAEEVRLSGFGTFAVVVRPPRTGRKPGTGEAIEIAEKQVVKFRPLGELKNAAKNARAA